MKLKLGKQNNATSTHKELMKIEQKIANEFAKFDNKDMEVDTNNNLDFDYQNLPSYLTAKNTIQGFAMLNCIDPYFKDNLQIYCIKTGRPLQLINENTLASMIDIHGRERAKMLLQYTKFSVSPEWILTDNIALDRLALNRPCEYTIYVISYLIPKILNDEIEPCFNQDAESRVITWQKIQQFNRELITNIAELCRQLLASNRPAAIRDMLSKFTLISITENAKNMGEFQLTLQACLQKVKDRYYDPDKLAARNRLMQRFMIQKKLKHLENWQLEIHLDKDLEEMELIEGITNPDIIAIKTQKASLMPKAQKKAKENMIQTSQFVGLKLRGKS